jgi:hypothetical protein
LRSRTRASDGRISVSLDAMNPLYDRTFGLVICRHAHRGQGPPER